MKLFAQLVAWRGRRPIQIGDVELIAVSRPGQRGDLMAQPSLQTRREPDDDVFEPKQDIVANGATRSGFPVENWQVSDGIRRVVRRPIVDMRIKPPTIGRRLKGQKRIGGFEQDDVRTGDKRGSCGCGDAGCSAADDRDLRIGMEIAEFLERVDQR